MAIATITYAFLCSWILPSDYLSPSENLPSANVSAIGKKRRLFLCATWIGLFIATIYTICTKQLLPVSILPQQIPLRDLQQITTKSLPVEKNDIPDPHRLSLEISNQEYEYLKNGQKIEVQLLYEVNSRGDLNPFLQKLSPQSRRDSEKNTKQIPRIGYYTVYSDAKKAYLTACINPRGMSTVNSFQFMHNRYSDDLTWNRLLPWILGKTVLRDDRCIWAQLSTPLNQGVATSVYPMLESIWSDKYNTWQSLFLAKQ
jgi:cyanosortase A-associated protein